MFLNLLKVAHVDYKQSPSVGGTQLTNSVPNLMGGLNARPHKGVTMSDLDSSSRHDKDLEVGQPHVWLVVIGGIGIIGLGAGFPLEFNWTRRADDHWVPLCSSLA